MGLHIDLESVYVRNLVRRKEEVGNGSRYAIKYGLLINAGDNYTKKEIQRMK